MTPWAGPTFSDHLLVAVLQEVWWTDNMHPSPTTGRPTRIRQRPTPSAGACYPVQTHLLLAGDSRANGTRAVYDHDRNRLITVGECTLRAGAVVVFTVLPQRTAAKYHHRAWPCLIADTAYAVTALIAVAARWGLAATRLADWSPDALARLAGLPRSGDVHGDWPQGWGGHEPELAVTAVYLGAAPAPALHGVRSTVRSPLAMASGDPSRHAHAHALARAEASSIAAAASVRLTAPRPGPRDRCPEQPVPGALHVPAISAEALAGRRSMPFAQMSQRPDRTGQPPGPVVGANFAPTVAPKWPATTDLTAWHASTRRLIHGITATGHPLGCRLHTLSAVDIDLLKEVVDRSSSQHWLHTSDLLVVFTAPDDADDAHLVACLWWATLTAANLVFQAAQGQQLRARTRPVAGWTDAAPNTPSGRDNQPMTAPTTPLTGQRILHGVALWHQEGTTA